MKNSKIKLSTYEDIKKFNEIACRYESDIDVQAVGTRYIVDAKSILGLVSLSMSRELQISIIPVNDMEERRFGYEFNDFRVYENKEK